MKSIWQFESQKPQFNTLDGDIVTDVLVIGGGITGILCGYMLKQAGVDYTVVEMNEICGGVTQNTTAKITYHHGAIFDKMIKRFGVNAAKLYVEAGQAAIDKYRDLCRDIDCDFKKQSSFVYSLNNTEKIKKEVMALKDMGVNAKFTTKLSLPFNASAVMVPNQAQFNPLKFLHTIAKDLKIYEHTKVLELTPDGVVTNHGRIRAKKIIVATHFPIFNKHGGYFLKMYQHRSYVIALKNAETLDGMYVDEADTGLSFRNYNGLLLLGGGGHRTGKKGGNWAELRRFALENYKKSQEVCRFATQDCKTLDDLPYIGQYSKNTPNMYVATGFNKWGMTTAMTAAGVLCDLVQGKNNKYSQIFSPSRSILRPQLAVNAAESAINLLTPTSPRCPHLGCALKYNRVEHSWDCPCHGSRFSKEGRLLDGPATDDKEIRDKG